jgi:hypothetical protein
MKLMKKLIGIILAVLMMSPIFIIWFQRQNIYDWFRLRNYTPPAQVVQLADNTSMVNEGRRLFYINRPVIASDTEFNEVCGRETSIVLGCYIRNRGIYIFKVTDPRLAGVQEVTAAHEMLHAAYERLSTSDKRRIDALTQQAYENVTSKRIRENVERYRAQDPSVVPNELHSILPTEVRELPLELEEYYQRYFSNRLAVVKYADQYESEFEKRVTRGEQLKQEIESLRSEIEATTSELTIQRNAIESSRRELDNLRRDGQFEEYNSNVPEFNNQIVSYNQQVQAVSAKIDRHDSLVNELRALQIEISDLYNVIDSRPQSL